MPSPRTQKGVKRPPNSGRAKGTLNKSTKEFKEALNHFIVHSQDDLLAWLKKVKAPEKRIECFVKIAEFVYPRLNRVNLVSDDKPIITVVPIINIPQNLSVDEWNKKFSPTPHQDKP